MRRRDTVAWLPSGAGKPVTGAPTGEAFQTEWIDFTRGIRVGNLQPHERITRILKHRLEESFSTPFVTDRWGRGVYWQWICWLPRVNREAKPVSHGSNFGCAKLFISVNRADSIFQCGLQVERGFVSTQDREAGWVLKEDWDWHRLMKQCAKGSGLEDELHRLLIREGFTVRVQGGGVEAVFDKGTFKGARAIREAARKCPPDVWAGFQLFYPMPAREVRSCGGYELVQAVLGAFRDVIGAMNHCMQVRLEPPPTRWRPVS
jgi:hypothetical protein